MRLEILTSEHDLSSFQANEKEFVEFLQNHALEEQAQYLSFTFLLKVDNNIIGFISVLCDKVRIERKYMQSLHNVHYNHTSALKIGKLCVHSKYRGKGYGKELVAFAIMMAETIAKTMAGCRLVTIDSKLSALDFYKKIGFKIMRPAKDAVPLFLDLLE